jgi:dienelactone hydrolase
MTITKPLGVLLSLAMISSTFAAIQTKEIDYKVGDATMKGVLAWDDATPTKRPGVLVIHEWWGNGEYTKKRAEMLASLGYVALAADMYGDGKNTADPKQAGEWAGLIKNDPQLGEQRLNAALDTLKAQPQVDDSKLAAIGYCFGGTCVLNLARMNTPLLGVVSFHGGLGNYYKLAPSAISTKVLVCHGADDEMVNKEVEPFIAEMKKANTDFQFISYAHTVHAFTNPDADKFNIPGIRYNPESDKRSWNAMKDFFVEIFGK